MNTFRKLILTLVGLLVFLHSVSLYALPVTPDYQVQETEMTEEKGEETSHLYSFDALVPAVQYIQSHIWHYVGEVVVVTQADFEYFVDLDAISGGSLELLFPHIISPNAP